MKGWAYIQVSSYLDHIGTNFMSLHHKTTIPTTSTHHLLLNELLWLSSFCCSFCKFRVLRLCYFSGMSWYSCLDCSFLTRLSSTYNSLELTFTALMAPFADFDEEIQESSDHSGSSTSSSLTSMVTRGSRTCNKPSPHASSSLPASPSLYKGAKAASHSMPL